MAHPLSLSFPKPLLFLSQTLGAKKARVLACNCNRGLKERNGGRTIRVSDPVRELDLSLLLLSDPALRGGVATASAVSVEQQEKRKDRGGGDDKQEYYVNMGYAIRSLREDLPDVFVKEPSFDIYRDDIVFKDPFNTFMGIDNYKRIFWSLRFVGNIFFKALWVDIVSVWQPVKNVVMIRWIVHGIPRVVPWEVRGRFDGISEYKLDKKGKIYEHRVFNIAPKPPTNFQVLSVDELVQSLGCPSTANPTYFETSLPGVVLHCDAQQKAKRNPQLLKRRPKFCHHKKKSESLFSVYMYSRLAVHIVLFDINLDFNVNSQVTGIEGKKSLLFLSYYKA